MAVQRTNASFSPGSVYVSYDSGSIFHEEVKAGVGYWGGVAMSDNGTTFLAVQDQSAAGDPGDILLYKSGASSWRKAMVPVIKAPPITDFPMSPLPVQFVYNIDSKKLGSIASVSTPIASRASGAPWYFAPQPAYWSSISSSNDGANLLAVQYYDEKGLPGSVYTSNDTGKFWSRQEGVGRGNWAACASSDDGTSLLVAVQFDDGCGGPGYIYTSNSSGRLWYRQDGAGPGRWSDVASSSDGQKLVAVQYEGNSPGSIFTSVDFGNVWHGQDGAGKAYWTAVASSGDGTVLLAAQDTDAYFQPGGLFISKDSGLTWTKQQMAGNGSWSSVAVSISGAVMAAAQVNGNTSNSPGSVFTSLDQGLTWIQEAKLQTAFWSSVAISGDGLSILVAQRQTAYAIPGSGALYSGTLGLNPGEIIGVAVGVGVGAGVGIGE